MARFHDLHYFFIIISSVFSFPLSSLACTLVVSSPHLRSWNRCPRRAIRLSSFVSRAPTSLLITPYLGRPFTLAASSLDTMVWWVLVSLNTRFYGVFAIVTVFEFTHTCIFLYTRTVVSQPCHPSLAVHTRDSSSSGPAGSQCKLHCELHLMVIV